MVFDIETAPVLGWVWGLWDQNIGLNQIQSDWHLLSWAAKWLGEKEVFYFDQRKSKKIEDDKKILEKLWELLDKADIVLTQNGKAFDEKKVNTRFVLNGMQPPSSYRHIDLKILAKKRFAFTSNKLEYITDKICTRYKKLKHQKFPGFELWRECMRGNVEAWEEMKRYNVRDVLSLEEAYKKIMNWDTSINFQVYSEETISRCNCKSMRLKRNGYTYTNIAKYRRYKCLDCGKETRGRENLLSLEKRASLKP